MTQGSNDRDPRLQFPSAPLENEIWQGDPDRKAVALTFDTEEDTAEELPKILDLLDEFDCKGSFFIRGEWAEEQPDALREIVRRGHPVSNHTWSHRAMTMMDDAEIAEELEKTEDVVRRVAGVSTKPFWRIPIGYRNEELVEKVEALGYRHAWLSAFADPRGDDPPEKAIAFGLSRARNGAIYLYHPRVPGVGAVVRAVMTQLREQGYAFQTVAEIVAS